MKKISYILGLLVLFIGIGFGMNAQATNNDCLSAVTSAPPAQTEPVTKEPVQDKDSAVQNGTKVPPSTVNPVSVAKHPNLYFNKKIQITARFNKFSTLGLDYKPAMRSSETYISFLIYRPDTDKNIPLSEMKLFLTRKYAEKFIDLKEGDIIQFTGTVFSAALGDAWVDVDNMTKINTEKKAETKTETK